MIDTIGQHVIAEMDGCDPAILSDAALILRHLLEAARRANATVLTHEVFNFNNGGVSGFVFLAESHVSIHTWPEHGYAAIDIYTCGDHTMPILGCGYLADALGAKTTTTTSMTRGVPDAIGHRGHRITTDRRTAFSRSVIPIPRSA